MSYHDLYKKRSQKSVKIDLSISLENFGPISQGSINLKPLTVFVGPNNSGKSYAAMLIHSILSSENQINSYGGRYGFESRVPLRLLHLFEKDLRNVTKKNKGKQSFSIPASITKKIFVALTQDVFRTNLESQITRNFASPVSELIRAKQKSAKIRVSNSNNFDVTIAKKFLVKTDIKFDIKYKCKISPKETDHYYTEKEEGDTIILTISKTNADDFLKYELVRWIVHSIASRLKHDHIPADSYYFPAARSGILQGHKALSASIIKSAPFGGIESFQIPKLTGVVSDFISNIILIPNRPGPFFRLAEQLETELLHGHIRLPTRIKDSFPEITYSSKHDEIPLHRTSSTISEIAPFSLYLKRIVYPSSLLIIEEPEAHLHPTNQLIFAKYIVKMIRAGLNVLVTTHSVFLLEQLGRFMLASKIKPEKRKKLGFDEDDFLSSEEVAPYVFIRHGDDNHTISPIETNDDEGISQEEFVKVNELLHSESIKLQESLSSD